jgi:hypothetical protein
MMLWLLASSLPAGSVVLGCTLGFFLSLYAQYLDFKLRKADLRWGLGNPTPDYFCVVRKCHLFDLNLAFWGTLCYLIGASLLALDPSYLKIWFWISCAKIILMSKLGYSLYNNYKEWCWICVGTFLLDLFLFTTNFFPETL